MNALSYLFHLWAVPPAQYPLACPPAPAGVTANSTGSFSFETVNAAYSSVAALSVFVILAMVAWCYLGTRMSTGPRFSRRYFTLWTVASVVCFLIPLVGLMVAPTTAEAGTCQSNPNAFPATLPMGLIFNRAAAGFVWGILAFVVVSLVATKLVGSWPSLKNGFYHNRGTPWPRFVGGK